MKRAISDAFLIGKRQKNVPEIRGKARRGFFRAKKLGYALCGAYPKCEIYYKVELLSFTLPSARLP